MDEAERRVVEARMKLRERWRAKILATRALSDPHPQGSGPPNRHGMPQLPPGQRATQKWPVLDLGRQPRIPLKEWQLTLEGACANPLKLDWQAFQQLEQVDDTSDFHCVTGWSKLDINWRGVRLADLAGLLQIDPEATHVICHAYDGYSTNLPLEEALKPDVLLVHTAQGEPLAREHGGPVRMITPQLYAWKGAKWICRLEFVVGDRLGYWERNGYSNTAHPWQNDRYSESAVSAPVALSFPYLTPLLNWLSAVLALSCAALIAANLSHHREWSPLIQSLSCLAAFGAIPYALWRAAHPR